MRIVTSLASDDKERETCNKVFEQAGVVRHRKGFSEATFDTVHNYQMELRPHCDMYV